MKFQRLTFFAALLLTLVMLVVALLFDYSKNDPYFANNFFWSLLLAIGSMLIINYSVLEFLFNYYGKKQISKMTGFLPEDLSSPNSSMNFKELGERINTLTEKNASEVGVLKEMETYRKEYVGNVSHELKTPLFSIQGYVETLMEGGVEDLNIRDKYLERIDKSVDRLISIVHDLDMINQYENDQISLNLSNFDVNLLVKEIIDLLDLEATQKLAKITLLNPQNAIHVRADKQKIFQVLINLISNAVYYSNREKAQINIKTGILKNKVFIEISDNGMGIKPEILPRIFERFYRAESSRNRKNGGSGLGLAIVKHILEAHDENIHVESEYLEGTKFSFLLTKA